MLCWVVLGLEETLGKTAGKYCVGDEVIIQNKKVFKKGGVNVHCDNKSPSQFII